MIYKPHKYQEYATQFVLDHPSCGIFLGCGLGKTVITLTAIKEMIFEVGKTLVIAPKKVAEATWSREATKWEHLSTLRVQPVLGHSRARESALEADADIYVINRENVPWLVEYYTAPPRQHGAWPFDCVVIDELTSFKNPKAKRFKALCQVLPRIKRVIGLTGTPSPNGLLDLWSQVYLLDRGERLGKRFGIYREAYFRPAARNGYVVYSWVARKGAAEEITRRISDICVSMKAEDYLDLPEKIIADVPVVLDNDAQKAYNDLEREMLLSVDAENITAASAAALTNKLLQLGNGNIYDENGDTHHIHDCKKEVFEELLESLGDDHALVFYGFRSDIPVLQEACKQAGKRSRMLENDADAQAWNEGRVDVLLAHPASCAYGLNLQDGGQHLIYYSLPWSSELYEQANARLHRQGQKGSVVVHRLLVRGGVDEDVAAALENKMSVQDAMIASLKARL